MTGIIISITVATLLTVFYFANINNQEMAAISALAGLFVALASFIAVSAIRDYREDKEALKRERAQGAPDASVVALDTSVVALDTSVVALDTSVVAPDASVVAPDASVVAPDASVVAPDASVVASYELVSIEPESAESKPVDTGCSSDAPVLAEPTTNIEPRNITWKQTWASIAIVFLIYVLYKSSQSHTLLESIGGFSVYMLTGGVIALISAIFAPQHSRIAFIAATAILALAVAIHQGSQYANFSDCMLQKMQGQADSMRGFAAQECRRLFP